MKKFIVAAMLVLFACSVSLAQSSSVLLGDINRDNSVNSLDISPFIAILATGGFQEEADFDGNGITNALDISGFIASLTNAPQRAEGLRGFYVDGFTSFQGNARAEQEFVDFVRDNKINYVLFYLRPTDVTTYGAKLSELINTLRSEAGVLQIGATTGGGSQVVVDHNKLFPGKFDVINLEDEFWREPQGTPERVVTLRHYTDTLELMNQIATGNNLKVEAYIGWITKPEMAQIVARLDRLLLHTYVSRAEYAYGYGQSRFEMISELKSDVELMPIYSVEKTEANREGGAVFMGQWMLDNSPNRSNYDFVAGFERAESIFNADYNAAVSGPKKLDVNLVGHHYFVYSQLINIPPTASIASPSPSHIVVEGGATPITFVMNGSDTNLNGAEWYQSGKGYIGASRFNGGTTVSRTITAAAPYSVVAVPFDFGLYGRSGLYASKGVEWKVLANNTLPTATAAFPANLDVYLEPGETQTFVHQARDIDGNLYAADWYSSNGYLGRSRIDGTNATTSRDIQFNQAGVFTVFVDLFDQALHMPGNTIRQNKVGRSVSWTVHVGSGTDSPAQTAPAKFTGRYVMVRKSGTGTLSLAEVQAFAPRPGGGETNLAMNKPATQSTTAYGGAASKGNDGGIDGRYSKGSITHSVGSSLNPWWRVDLGADYDVSAIVVWNRTDCCSERLDGAVVYIGDSPSTNPADYTVVGELNGGKDVQVFESN